MDPTTQLALVSKAREVFGGEDTFLAFPVTPLVHDRRDLDFTSTVTEVDAVLARRANVEAFSLLCNLIPKGEAWLPGEARFLWDEYELVLQRGRCAESTRTESEERRYREARAYLKVDDGTGVPRDSPALIRYRECEDEWYLLQEEFAEARVSGELADTEEARRRWTDVEEPSYRERIAELEQRWVVDGFRNEVEEARDRLVALGAKSPSSTWVDWQDGIGLGINEQTGAATGVTVRPTSFAPANALDDGMWQTFRLDATTIEALVAKAPETLRTKFSIGDGRSRIASMTLEFSSAVVNRPWFDPEVFRARFWRLDDKVLSDGDDPASGDCTAYVSALVFARRVVVREKNASTPRPIRQPSQFLRFEHLVHAKSLSQRIDPILLQAIQPPRVGPGAGVAVRPAAFAALKRGAAARPRSGSGRRDDESADGTRRSRAAATSKRPLVTAGALRPAVMLAAQRPVVAAGVRPTLAPVQPKRPARPAVTPYVFVPTFHRPPIVRPPSGSGPAPAEDVAPDAATDDEVMILAFVCTRVPKCPDPDPTLRW